MTPVYIHSAAAVSPQQTWGVAGLESFIVHQGNQLACIEPNYETWIDAKQLRRMSRIMKMGAATALLALKNAGIQNPDAIITGTGSGCLDDTGSFLDRMITNHEVALNPTPFIQSTHNTIGSHIALLLHCQAYNQTYSHGSFSFESAMIDAMLRLSEDSHQNILVGGADEITHASHLIQSRFGIYKKECGNSLEIFKSKSKGTLHGEGVAWFVVSDQPSVEKISVAGVKTIYNPGKNQIGKCISDFLSECSAPTSAVDLILLGKSGDKQSDAAIDQAIYPLFYDQSIAVYKHLCGEYETSSSFALWLAYSILKTKKIAIDILERNSDREVKTILIYNTYFRDHHSFILVKRDDS